MIISGISGMKPFIPTIMMKSSNSTVFTDALDRAQSAVTRYITGTALMTLVDNNQANHQELYTLLARVIAVTAFVEEVPRLDLSLADSGFVVTNNEAVSAASRQRVDKLIASLKESLPTYYDDLVDFLCKSDTYSDWKGTEQYKFISSGMICTFRDFENFLVLPENPANFIIPKSWMDLKKLFPKMNKSLMVDVAYYISYQYAVELLENFVMVIQIRQRRARLCTWFSRLLHRMLWR